MGVVDGTSAADTIAATSGDDVIYGQGGDDNLTTAFPTGELHGGDGKDQLGVQFEHIVAADYDLPRMRWALFGGDGDDTVEISAQVDTPWDAQEFSFGPNATIDLAAEGGAGNDKITLTAGFGLWTPWNFGERGPYILNTVTDLFGNNTILIDSYNGAVDMTPSNTHRVVLGDGNDNLTLRSAGDGFNNGSSSHSIIDLGSGTNTAAIQEMNGHMSLELRSAGGVDTIDVVVRGDPANAEGVNLNTDMDVGGGNDAISLSTSWYPDGYGSGRHSINLGDGDDTLTVEDGTQESWSDSALGGSYLITAGGGDDLVTANVGPAGDWYYTLPNDIDIDLGAGDDRLLSEISTGNVDILGGAGNDSISLAYQAGYEEQGAVTVDLGAGTNELILASTGGSSRVLAGSGDDVVEMTWTDDTGSYSERTRDIVVDLGTGRNLLTLLIGEASPNSSGAIGQVIAGSGNDVIVVHGGAANTIHAGAGDDVISGLGGIDTMHGGDGSDIYTVDSTTDLVIEANAASAGGADRIDTWLSSYTLGAHVEKGRIMSTGAANLVGNALNNALFAGLGDNVLDGAAGTGDSVSYVYATDAVTVDLTRSGAQQVTGGSGDDTLIGIEHLAGSLFDDRLAGDDGSNWLGGDAGGDLLQGGGGADRLVGGAGNDTMEGGAGDDLYVVDAVADQIVEQAGGGLDQVRSSVGFTLGDHVENLVLTGSDPLNGTGNGLNNRITGNDAGNVLNGKAGNDRLDGGAGRDTLAGEAGNDILVGGLGNDRLGAGTGLDRLAGGDGDDVLTFLGVEAGDRADGGAGTDSLWLTGGAKADSISVSQAGTGAVFNELAIGTSIERFQFYGGNGSDALTGGVRADFLYGGHGKDRLHGAAGHDLLQGEKGNDVLDGGLGNDRLYSGVGRDTMTGGLGNDAFVFTARSKGTNVITDFHNRSGDNDLFRIDASSFGGRLVEGRMLAASQFRARADNLAQDADDRFIFRTTDKTLWFDSNGKTSGGRTLVADLQADATVTYADILLV